MTTAKKTGKTVRIKAWGVFVAGNDCPDETFPFDWGPKLVRKFMRDHQREGVVRPITITYKEPSHAKYPEPLTPAVIAELERLLAEATGDDGPPKLELGEFQKRPWLLYLDGDGCAEIHGNLGLGIGEQQIAALIVAAVNALPDLLTELSARLEREGRLEEALRKIVRCAGYAESSYPNLWTTGAGWHLKEGIEAARAALAEGRVGG